MDGFEPPSTTDEFARQPIEQFGVRGLGSLDSEIIGRGDESLTEMVLPQTIDDDSGEQVAGTVGGVGHPESQ